MMRKKEYKEYTIKKRGESCIEEKKLDEACKTNWLISITL